MKEPTSLSQCRNRRNRTNRTNHCADPGYTPAYTGSSSCDDHRPEAGCGVARWHCDEARRICLAIGCPCRDAAGCGGAEGDDVGAGGCLNIRGAGRAQCERRGQGLSEGGRELEARRQGACFDRLAFHTTETSYGGAVAALFTESKVRLTA